MKFLKTFLIWWVIFSIIFIVAYVATDLIVNAIMSDVKYNQSITVNAIVKGLEVKEYKYTLNEKLQPAFNINELDYDSINF